MKLIKISIPARPGEHTVEAPADFVCTHAIPSTCGDNVIRMYGFGTVDEDAAVADRSFLVMRTGDPVDRLLA